MTSAKLRAWGSYLSKKVDDTFYSIIPKPPQSEPQVSDPQVSDPQVSDPQEADPPYQQELLYIRERHEACRSDEATAAYIYRRKQIHEQKAAEHAELLRKNTLRTFGLLYTGLAVGFAIVFIIIFTTLF